MPLFGAHMSIAGGLHNAVTAAVEHDCGTLQIFSKNASQWAAKPLQEPDIATFRKAVKNAKLKFVTAHDSYLINLASPDDGLYRKSIAAFVDEIERAEALGLSYLVTHPGAHTGSGVEAGIARVVAAIDEVHMRTAGFKVKVLLELTAGQGSCLGAKFEEIAVILDRVTDAKRLAFGGFTDKDFRFVGEGNHAGGQTVPFRVGDDLRLASLHHGDHAVRGSQVDPDNLFSSSHLSVPSFGTSWCRLFVFEPSNDPAAGICVLDSYRRGRFCKGRTGLI